MPSGALDGKSLAMRVQRHAFALVEVGKVLGEAKVIEAVAAAFDVAGHGALQVSASGGRRAAHFCRLLPPKPVLSNWVIGKKR